MSDKSPTAADEPVRNVMTMDDAQALMRRNNELLEEIEQLRAKVKDLEDGN